MLSSHRSLGYGPNVCRYRSHRIDFSPGAARRGRRGILAFQTDSGGWNNILMQFEIMVVMAWITGRTLVLPPARRFYLLGEEPRLLEDFLDLNELRRLLPVLTAAEFVEYSELGHEAAADEEFHQFMHTHGYMPPWNGLDNILSCSLLTRCTVDLNCTPD